MSFPMFFLFVSQRLDLGQKFEVLTEQGCEKFPTRLECVMQVSRSFSSLVSADATVKQALLVQVSSLSIEDLKAWLVASRTELANVHKVSLSQRFWTLNKLLGFLDLPGMDLNPQTIAHVTGTRCSEPTCYRA